MILHPDPLYHPIIVSLCFSVGTLHFSLRIVHYTLPRMTVIGFIYTVKILVSYPIGTVSCTPCSWYLISCPIFQVMFSLTLCNTMSLRGLIFQHWQLRRPLPTQSTWLGFPHNTIFTTWFPEYNRLIYDTFLKASNMWKNPVQRDQHEPLTPPPPNQSINEPINQNLWSL